MSKEKHDFLVGFAVNPELVARFDSSRQDTKLSLDALLVDLSGSSADVAIALSKLGYNPLLIGFTGYTRDVQDILLDAALAREQIPYRLIPLLEKTSCAVFPADAAKPTRVAGRRWPPIPELVPVAQRTLHDIITVPERAPSAIAVITGAKTYEEPFINTAFGTDTVHVLNPNVELASTPESFHRVLAQTHMLIMNDYEAKQYFRDKTWDCGMFHEHGVDLVIITEAERGGRCSLRGMEWRFPAVKAPQKTIYTPGAGDWFLGGFLAKVAEKKQNILAMNKNDIDECIAFAARVAAAKITYPGAANGPARHELDAIIPVIKTEAR